MQHDVFINPGRVGRTNYPFVTVLQSDAAEGDYRLVCPLGRPFGVVASRSMPEIIFNDARLLLAIELIFAMPTRVLRRPVGTIAAYRDDIVYALDWLFTGI